MEEAKRKQILDYLTTLLLASIPVILVAQPQILAAIPAQYTILATIGFAILSQLAANDRVKAASAKMGNIIDGLQNIVEGVFKKVDTINKSVDTVQTAVADVNTALVGNTQVTAAVQEKVDDSQKAIAKVVAVVKETSAKVDDVQTAVEQVQAQ